MRVGYITLSQRQSSNPGNGNSQFNFSNESQSRFICIEADDLSILFGLKKNVFIDYPLRDTLSMEKIMSHLYEADMKGYGFKTTMKIDES